ncbi:MAG: hypothetical protein Q7S99_14190 [Parvibaculum sp.]|nr:hypothetical protein [Parvibaculum sp.]|tara:strand:+ start:974 stop:1363 length:390 start_codon:yes stop_codon:yes gene_type:complete
MSNWFHSIAFCLVIAFAMTLGTLSSTIAISASHNPITLAAAQAARHAELAVQVEAHGHDHDDGIEDEQNPGHTHGHNQADHTHETASALPTLAQPVRPIGQSWLVPASVFADLDTRFRLERPPRLTIIA